MIKKLFVLLLIVPCLVMAQPRQKPGVTYDAVITRVIDGDTVAFQAPFLPAPQHSTRSSLTDQVHLLAALSQHPMCVWVR